MDQHQWGPYPAGKSNRFEAESKVDFEGLPTSDAPVPGENEDVGIARRPRLDLYYSGGTSSAPPIGTVE